MDDPQILITLFLILYLYIITIIIHMFIKIKKLDSETRNYYRGLVIFMIFFTISQLIGLNRYNCLFPDATPNCWVFYITTNFLGYLGLFFLIFVVERYVYNKLHYIPSIISLITVILIIVLPKINDINIVNIYLFIEYACASIIPILYYIVAYQTSGNHRKKSLTMGTSIIFIMVGVFFTSAGLIASSLLFGYIGFIIQVIGLILFHYGLLFIDV